jgi:hypothetical protein
MIHLFQEPAVHQPLTEAEWPGAGGGGGAGFVAKAVSGVAVDVQLRFHTGGLVFEIEAGHALGDVGAVAVAAGDEERGHAFLHGEEVGGAGIDQRLEVGAAACLLDGIGRAGVTCVGLHGGESGEFTAGGETDDANLVGLDAPLLSLAADRAKCAARVGHGVVLDGVGAVGVLVAGQPVLQDKGGDAVFLEPLCQSIAFVTKTELGVTATRGDDHCQPGVVLGWQIGRDRGIVDVGDIAAVQLLRLTAAGFGARGSVGPQGEFGRVTGLSAEESAGGEGDGQEEGWEGEFHEEQVNAWETVTVANGRIVQYKTDGRQTRIRAL